MCVHWKSTRLNFYLFIFLIQCKVKMATKRLKQVHGITLTIFSSQRQGHWRSSTNNIHKAARGRRQAHPGHLSRQDFQIRKSIERPPITTASSPQFPRPALTQHYLTYILYIFLELSVNVASVILKTTQQEKLNTMEEDFELWKATDHFTNIFDTPRTNVCPMIGVYCPARSHILTCELLHPKV